MWTPTILAHFDSLRYTPPQGSFTVLAAFYLVNEQTNGCKIISMATGTKCLPTRNYSRLGDVVHDTHAEVLARRGAVRWLMCEMARGSGDWLTRDGDTWSLQENVTINLYISELPCGEASTRALARIQAVQNPAMAVLKSDSLLGSKGSATLDAIGAVRGREGYELLNRVRTKPGRGDSPPTNAMSCSDKIALWSVMGIQGALLTSIGMKSVHLSTITIGGVLTSQDTYGDIEFIREDCDRALFRRVEGSEFETLTGHRLMSPIRIIGYRLHPPLIAFTDQNFRFQRDLHSSETQISTNEALCWIADEPGKEVLVNGARRGTSPKHRSAPTVRPRVAKASFFALYQRTASIVRGARQTVWHASYREAKHGEGTEAYHSAKARLRGEGGPLHGWVICDTEYETFALDAMT